MALSVVGSGFGRTGTKSLKEALEILGVGPCHHMHDLFETPDTIAGWQRASRGESVEWEQMFDGYLSQIDWPGSHYWRELTEAFPESLVIHTIRPEDVWCRSFERTIGKLLGCYKQLDLPPHVVDILDVNMQIIGEQTFGGNFNNRDSLLSAYRKRTDEVVRVIDPDRLLIFDVAQGWEPLCSFLNVPVPDKPFPRNNLRSDFWNVVGGEPSI
jgi:hypothetical protein